MPRSRLLLGWCAVLFVLYSPAPAFPGPVSPPFDLYELAGLRGDELETAATHAGDWQVLHREESGGESWLLLVLPSGGVPTSLGTAAAPRHLATVQPGQRVVLAAALRPGRPALLSGRALTVTPGESTVLLTRENLLDMALRAPEGFRVLQRSFPLPRPRLPGPSPRFADILARADDVTARVPSLRTTAQVESLVNLVSLDSLLAIVDTLSLTAAGQPVSRYWARDFTENEAKLRIASLLEAMLAPYGGTVTSQAFEISTAETTKVATNIIARLPSALPNAGAVLVTAHYDAIGTRTDPVRLCEEDFYGQPNDCDCNQNPGVIREDPNCAWDWRRDPAPGGNDNATGVAVLIEAARALGGVEFDFDVYFVAFQGEELGLLGSAALADSIANADGQEIYAVINADEIGYNPDFNQVDVTVNERSEWLADLIASAGATFTPDLVINKKVEFFARSDHASFWSIGVDAVLLNEDNDVSYPDYHTIDDTWQTVLDRAVQVGRDPANAQLQFLFTTQLVVATLGRLALEYTGPDLALPAGELEAAPGGVGNELRTGSPVQLIARVRNLGKSSLTYMGVTTDSLSARVTFYDGDPDHGAAEIGAVSRTAFFPSAGGVDFTHPWTPPPGGEGFHEIHAVVEGLDPGYLQSEVSADNNEESIVLFLQAPANAGPRLLTLHPYPNPVRGSREDLRFYYELTLPAAVQLQIFDLEGRNVGIYAASLRFVSEGNRPGVNRIGGRDFDWVGGGLQSGVYVFAMQLRDASGRVTDEKSGKFALIR